MKKLIKWAVGCLLCAGIIFFIAYIFWKSSQGNNEDSLVAVSVIYRHGDRTPINFYPNDPYKDPSLWSAQPGELTNDGKLKHYQFGKWLRNRYDGFLSPIYNKSEIYVSSSDRNRCLMSAASNLAGLYPPQGKDKWQDDLPWQPIPIHSTPLDKDQISGVLDSCRIFQPLLDRAEMEIPKFLKLNTDNKKLFEYVTEKTGMEVKEMVKAAYIFDTIHVEQLHNMSVPEWAVGVYDQLRYINNASFEMLTYNETFSRYYMGRFYYKVLSQFNHFVDPNSTVKEKKITQKFRIYSAHDMEVYSSLHALKIQLKEPVPFVGATILELRKTSDGRLYVQILYKTEDDVPQVMQIDKCGEKCDFDKFVKLVKPIIITEEDFNKECSKV